VGDPLDPTPNLDGSRALALAGLRDIDLAYREMIVGLGVRSQAAQRRSHVQADVINRVRAEQEAANGVNLDEELSDLVRFQRAYEASARFISVVDELLDTLINRTGR
jgi:flagellar hook-associated protein 1 FlgK